MELNLSLLSKEICLFILIFDSRLSNDLVDFLEKRNSIRDLDDVAEFKYSSFISMIVLLPTEVRIGSFTWSLTESFDSDELWKEDSD